MAWNLSIGWPEQKKGGSLFDRPPGGGATSGLTSSQPSTVGGYQGAIGGAGTGATAPGAGSDVATWLQRLRSGQVGAMATAAPSQPDSATIMAWLQRLQGRSPVTGGTIGGSIADTGVVQAGGSTPPPPVAGGAPGSTGVVQAGSALSGLTLEQVQERLREQRPSFGGGYVRGSDGLYRYIG